MELYCIVVFTYDARRVVARQWTSPDYNGAALRFLVDSFQLEITNVSSLDQGWWHCRVEFEMSSFRVQSTQVVVVGTRSALLVYYFYYI